MTPVAGHSAAEQSRTPLPKSMFVHKQVTLFAAHPSEVAFPNMLLMHVFCVTSQYISIGWSTRVEVSLTPQSGRPLTALRSWARARPAKSAAVATKTCIVKKLVLLT